MLRENPQIYATGKELDVGTLRGECAEGWKRRSYYRTANRNRDNSHRWAKRYDGTLENIFELQTDISQKIAEELDIEFSSTTEVSVGEDAVKKKEAHDIASAVAQ